MRLLWAELRDFRNHRHTRVEPHAGLATVVGPNGEGKTNLLEGLFFLFSLESPRVSASEPTVRVGAESAFVRGEVETAGDGKVLIEIEIKKAGANVVRVNGTPVRRKRDVRKLVRSVFFGPDDLATVQGDPGERRRFMDEAVVSLWAARDSALRAYDRALRQRNRMLKEWDGAGAPPDMDVWDSELIEAGTLVMELRDESVGRMAPTASREFEALAGYALELKYAPSVPGSPPTAEGFAKRLAERRNDELVRRTSLVGPHRDDLSLAVRDLAARGFASHGEAWAASLALRLGQGAAVGEEAGDAPVLLLDDPFSALDPARRARVAEALVSKGQVVVSVADESHVPVASEAVWDVSAGRVKVRD